MVPSRNPGDLDEVPVGFSYSFEHLHEAVDEAKGAFKGWRQKTFSERATPIKKYRDELFNHRERLAIAVSNEVGKPYWESLGEINDTLSLIDFL